jgi:hypothetical protein
LPQLELRYLEVDARVHAINAKAADDVDGRLDLSEI